ncbi:hypothetical protein [Chitinophaga sp. sic0106]|uniref:hypothetical protein n=1 Tax=Chitinophaga sp. sic0106 TaxID=2854785 RepID=UPI001C440AE8|nr:hypothetical protein [Chitinophaga sp. sic0106]MBV7529778.1 hypothetical protein [Chitinophaga sp. sic0106]
MITVPDINTLFDAFEKRNQPIRNLDKLRIGDADYLPFVTNYKSQELGADIILLDYEATLQENRYLTDNYPDLAPAIWLFARSGQGDEWFIDRKTLRVLYYDHEKGEYADLKDFLEMPVKFAGFVQLGLVIQQLEDRLDTDDHLKLQAEYKAALDQIHPQLYGLYPYKYFED